MSRDADNSNPILEPPLLESIGLCAFCQHRRTQATKRGAVFHRCLRADADPAYLQYPPLPVLRCPGYVRTEARTEERTATSSEETSSD